MEKLFENSLTKDARGGPKQFADIQHSAFVHPHFTLMRNSLAVTVVYV